jgi:hypothetical protein
MAVHKFHVEHAQEDLEADAVKMTPRGTVKKFAVPATL